LISRRPRYVPTCAVYTYIRYTCSCINCIRIQLIHIYILYRYYYYHIYITSRVSCVGIIPNNIILNKTMVDDPAQGALTRIPHPTLSIRDLRHIIILIERSEINQFIIYILLYNMQYACTVQVDTCWLL